MARNVEIIIRARASCDDDRWLSRDLATAARCALHDAVGRDGVRNGTEPHYFTDVVQVRNSMAPGVVTYTDVTVTYEARFRWWHRFVPARMIPYGGLPRWLRRAK